MRHFFFLPGVDQMVFFLPFPREVASPSGPVRFPDTRDPNGLIDWLVGWLASRLQSITSPKFKLLLPGDHVQFRNKLKIDCSRSYIVGKARTMTDLLPLILAFFNIVLSDLTFFFLYTVSNRFIQKHRRPTLIHPIHTHSPPRTPPLRCMYVTRVVPPRHQLSPNSKSVVLFLRRCYRENKQSIQTVAFS